MARNESDREDLMEEMVALVRRIELKGQLFRKGSWVEETVFAGFRKEMWLSLYIGPDPMYLFDQESRLRRAFVGGRLFRTQGTTLACMIRERTPHSTTLVRTDLTPNELEQFRESMLDDVTSVFTAIENRTLTEFRRFPEPDTKLLSDISLALHQIMKSTEFLAPPIAGKK